MQRAQEAKVRLCPYLRWKSGKWHGERRGTQKVVEDTEKEPEGLRLRLERRCRRCPSLAWPWALLGPWAAGLLACPAPTHVLGPVPVPIPATPHRHVTSPLLPGLAWHMTLFCLSQAVVCGQARSAAWLGLVRTCQGRVRRYTVLF